MEQLYFTLAKDFFVGLFREKKEDAFAKLIESLLNQVLLAESDEEIGAARYERSEERQDSRNGFRERGMNLRIGKLTLQVPRHRNEPFKTSMFDDYQRSEQALMETMIEMVVQGVATRNVQKITEELCGTKFSKSTVSELCKKLDVPLSAFRNRLLSLRYPFLFVDAIYFKVREEGRAISKAFMVAVGVNEEGHKEILGFGAYENESEETWRNFLESLKTRGLHGVDIITSDAHTGLRNAIQKSFPSVPWQRCQFHFKRNILDKAKQKDKHALSIKLRDLFDSTTIEEARKLRDEIIEEYAEVAAEAMRILDEGFEDSMAVLSLPKIYRVYTRTSNVLERENRELRKRQSIIGVFPNVESLLRLMGAVLMDDHNSWQSCNRACAMDEYYLRYEETKRKLEKLFTRLVA